MSDSKNTIPPTSTQSNMRTIMALMGAYTRDTNANNTFTPANRALVTASARCSGETEVLRDAFHAFKPNTRQIITTTALNATALTVKSR